MQLNEKALVQSAVLENETEGRCKGIPYFWIGRSVLVRISIIFKMI